MPKSGNKHIFGFGTGVFQILGFATLIFLTKQVPGSALQLALDRDAIAFTARFDGPGDLKRILILMRGNYWPREK